LIATVAIASIAVGVVLYHQREARCDALRRARQQWAETRLTAARNAMDAELLLWERGRGWVDGYCQRSVWVMESERDLADSPAQKFAALLSHRDRMLQIHQRTGNAHITFDGPYEENRKISESYLAEAESWVTRAELGR
jgi:hypothetical protein